MGRGAGGGSRGERSGGGRMGERVVTNEKDAEALLKKVTGFGSAAAGIQEYTKQGNYHRINEALRNDKSLSKNDQEIVDRVDRGLNKLPAYKGVVYRGESLIDVKGKIHSAESYLKDYEVGKTVTAKAFTSTTTRESVMNRFVGHTGIKIAIKAKGSRGKAVLSKGPHPDEYEVLFKRGTKFKVLRKEIGKTATGLPKGLLVLEEL